MKTGAAFLFFLFALALGVSAECTIPADGLVLGSSTTLCPGNYSVSGMMVEGTNIDLSCQGTVLEGSGEGVGIAVLDSYGVSIRDCTLRNYEIGIGVRNSASVSLTGNTLGSSKFGVAVMGSGGIDAQNNTFLGTLTERMITVPEEESMAAPETGEETASAQVSGQDARAQEPGTIAAPAPGEKEEPPAPRKRPVPTAPAIIIAAILILGVLVEGYKRTKK
ncbi:TPA: hypothetical protein HA280_02095 [Candidatus Woesearchaeota archaeon]|nr:hypothetical protein [Candidatus Woesearchaeota archaeon]